jgi:fructoselysine 6-kinase
VQLARLGCPVDYLGAVGADPGGQAVCTALEANGVGTGRVRRLPDEETARTDIETLPDGDRRFVFECFGASGAYRPDAADLQFLARKRLVHIGWMRGAAALRQVLRVAGVVVSQDLTVNNDPSELDPAGLDIAFGSAMPQAGEAESERFLARGARLAVITLGAAGSLANDGRQLHRIDAVPTDVVDTTGAGDSFIAGFLESLAKGLKIKECLLQGAALGATACRHRGGFPQQPLQPFVQDSRAGNERLLEPD